MGGVGRDGTDQLPATPASHAAAASRQSAAPDAGQARAVRSGQANIVNYQGDNQLMSSVYYSLDDRHSMACRLKQPEFPRIETKYV